MSNNVDLQDFYTGLQTSRRMFLKLEGIIGESKENGHIDEIELNSFDFGSHQSRYFHFGSIGPGKAILADLWITKKLDKTSQELFAACAIGKLIPKGILTVDYYQKDKKIYIGSYIFSNLSVVAISIQDSGESIQFSCEKMEQNVTNLKK